MAEEQAAQCIPVILYDNSVMAIPRQ